MRYNMLLPPRIQRGRSSNSQRTRTLISSLSSYIQRLAFTRHDIPMLTLIPVRMLQRLRGHHHQNHEPKHPRPPHCVSYSKTVYRPFLCYKISPPSQIDVHQSVMTSFEAGCNLANNHSKAALPDARMQRDTAVPNLYATVRQV